MARQARWRWLAAPLALAVAVPLPAQQAPAQQSAAPPSAPVRQFGRVSYDSRSMMIDGKRLVIWSSEFHPFRLPSPDLWRDILQKMKASGFNTVAVYFDWGYHSPKQGVYDFTGVRDMDRMLDMAAEEGLYVITRAGPYVNAELTRGGFPGWLVNQRARARTDDPEYLKATDEWMTAIDAIITHHQINGGPHGEKGGTVILHQIENELAVTAPAQRRYMDHLYAKARADGITVPIFHNDQSRNGYWVPAGGGVPNTVEGPNNLYAFDGYPGGTCTVAGQPTRGSAAPDWGYYGPGGAKGGASASPTTPGFLAEFGGGWFDYWGSNGGYECNAVQRGKRFQRVFYGTNLANGIGIQSFYMGYGGTSWGWLPAPVVFTSYDYGAAISEPRDLRPKTRELKQLAGLIGSVPDLAGMVPAVSPATASVPTVQVYHDRNPDSDARFLFVAHKPSNGQGDDRFTITADLPDGHYTFPQGQPMQLNGFDAKWLVAAVALGRQRLIYSTSELQALVAQDGADVALFYGRDGEPGETALRYASAPTVTVIEGQVAHRFDAVRGDLILDYTHGGLARVAIAGGGRPPLTLLIGTEAVASAFWRVPVGTGAVLVRGPDLVRHAAVSGSRLALAGDTVAQTPLEIWAPARLRTVSWNGRPVATRPAAGGARAATVPLPGPAPVALPVLTAWRSAAGSPEAAPGFDDAAWQPIDRRGGSGAVQPPTGQPTMTMDAYNFHEGDVWYRGRFTGTPDARTLQLHYGAGGAGMLQVWLDGHFLGQHELAGGLPRPITTGVASFALPSSAVSGEHILAVTVRNDGHNWDLDADDFHKEARGLVSASIEAPGGNGFAVPIAWRIQGRLGGEDFADAARGVPNNGGQYGERMGWHLPGFDDARWASATLPASGVGPGTTWYRTRFALDVPNGQDATIGVAFGDTTRPRSAGARYRALLFVNGWNMGQFIAHVGPQRVFPVPEGILNHHGPNVLALAVTSDGVPDDALEAVKLVTMRTVAGGVPVRMVDAPRTLAEADRR